MFRSLVAAFSIYSIVPMPQIEWKEQNTRWALCFFPLVGLVTGGVMWGWLWLGMRLTMPFSLVAAVAVALPLILSGGIHMDGFCDTVDALASHAPAVRKLEILKDPHAGAFAVVGCGVYLLLCYGLWGAYAYTPRSAAVLLLGFILSRALSGFSVLAFRRARPDGMAAALAQDDSRRRAAVNAVIASACAAGMLLLGTAGIAAVLTAVLIFAYYRYTAFHDFGGVTGDLAGYFLQLCELGMLAAVVLTQGVQT